MNTAVWSHKYNDPRLVIVDDSTLELREPSGLVVWRLRVLLVPGKLFSGELNDLVRVQVAYLRPDVCVCDCGG